MKRLVLSVLLTITIIVPASALFEETDLQDYVDRYNANLEKAPGILKDLLGRERVEVNIMLDNGTLYQVGLETERGKVVRTVPGGYENPTISVDAREDVIQRISSADDKVDAFQMEMAEGNIAFTANTIAARLKLAAVLSSIDVLRFFAGFIFK